MTGRRRTAFAWCGLSLITTTLAGSRLAAAGQPVHEVADRYTFEPATIRCRR
jgi:hypothetical protein